MNAPNDFRERLPDLLDERAPQRAPEQLLGRFAERMETERQRPGWANAEFWLPQPAERSSSMRRAGIMLAALILLTLALTAGFAAGSRLLTSQVTITVAADGSGDVRTLRDAVARATAGDTILIRPGTYTEAVRVDQAVDIRGDGEREQVVIRAPVNGPTTATAALSNVPASAHPYALLIDDADVTIQGLTFAGGPAALVVQGGAPTIEGNWFDGVGQAAPNRESEAGTSAIVLKGGSLAVIRDNELTGVGSIVAYDLSEPLIEGNDFHHGGRENGGHILGLFGDRAVIRGNLIDRSFQGVESWADATPLIEANRIVDPQEHGIYVALGAPIVRGNQVFHPGGASSTGILIEAGSGTVEDNTITGFARGVQATRFEGTIAGNTIDSGFEGMTLTETNGTVSDNRITAVFAGINLSRSSPAVVDNVITGPATGVSVTGMESAPTFSGNELCSTNRPLVTSEGANEPDTSGLGGCRGV